MQTKYTTFTASQTCSMLYAMLWLSVCTSCDHESKVSRRSLVAPRAADANQEPSSPFPPDDSVEKEFPTVSTPSPTPRDVPLRDLPTPFALRRFDQVNATMASLTGVSALPTSLVPAPIQDGLQTMLPGENRVTDFQGGSQFATYKLAAEYCNIMVDNEATKPSILTNIDLKKPPREAFSEAGKSAVVKIFTDKFWVLPPTNLPQAQGLLADLIAELMAGKTLTTAAQTAAAQTTAIVKAVCTATLASAPVSFY